MKGGVNDSMLCYVHDFLLSVQSSPHTTVMHTQRRVDTHPSKRTCTLTCLDSCSAFISLLCTAACLKFLEVTASFFSAWMEGSRRSTLTMFWWCSLDLVSVCDYVDIDMGRCKTLRVHMWAQRRTPVHRHLHHNRKIHHICTHT